MNDNAIVASVEVTIAPFHFWRARFLLHYGRELNYEIGGKRHKISPSGGQVFIHLAPGRQNYSADIAGYGRAGGTLEIVAGRYITQQWADR